MNIIILGAGRVGESVAESLVSEQNDITVIDTDPQRLRELQDRLDLRGVTGNGIHPSVLKAAGVDDADMLIACAPLDETNLVACKLAHDLFNVPTTIARLRSPEFQDGSAADRRATASRVDAVICPEESVTRYIRKLIEYPEALQVLEFATGPGQPDRGARDQRRPDGAATSSPSCRSWCPAVDDALRRDLPHRRARQRPPDPVRRRDAHRAGRRGLRAGRDEGHPRACSTRCAGATSRCGA